MALKAHSRSHMARSAFFVRRVHQHTGVLGLDAGVMQRVAVNRRIVILVDCWAGLHRHMAA
jgi:hypothetical protein